MIEPLRTPSRPRILDPGPQVRPVAVAAVSGSRVITNDEVAGRLGVDPHWIERRTGIVERRHAAPHESLLGMASEAAERALRTAGLNASEIAVIAFATITPDAIVPHMAPQLAGILGCPGAMTFDLQAACAGFVTATSVVESLLARAGGGYGLVVGADMVSRIADPSDRASAGLFGDGAGVMVLRAERSGTPNRYVFGSDAEHRELITAPRGGVLAMQGPDTYEQAVRRMSESAAQCVAEAGWALDEVDAFLFHQANRRILQAVQKRLGADPERVIDVIGRLGNTSAATIPLALQAAAQQGRLHDGAKLLICAFGAGLMWGAGALRWAAPATP